MHVHETLPLPIHYKLLARLVYRHSNHLIGVSEKSCDMIRSLGIPADRVSRIYNGVAPAFLEDVEPVEELRGPGPHIGIFGAIEPRKGQEYFIRAATKVLQNHPTSKFWVVGSTSYQDNEVYFEHLKDLAGSLQIAQHIRFVGFRRDVPQWMAGMDVIVLASTGMEALPTVIIEAGALGVPVVATTVGGVAEILTHGETGMLVPPKDPDLIAEAVGQLLGPKGNTVSQRVKFSIRAKFSRSLFDHAILNCYKSFSHEKSVV
jgi:glycosyltransferase involved in cell wall biosynthesis